MLKNKFGNRLISNEESGNVNPMDGLSNMSDAMLVLAVGIMLALVINWRIDISKNTSTEIMTEVSEEKLKEIEYEMMKDSNISANEMEQKYQKSGTVYTDQNTGKTYVIMD